MFLGASRHVLGVLRIVVLGRVLWIDGRDQFLEQISTVERNALGSPTGGGLSAPTLGISFEIVEFVFVI